MRHPYRLLEDYWGILDLLLAKRRVVEGQRRTETHDARK